MSVKEGKDYLYLIWKCEKNRRQYIVGQLTRNGQYEFQYSEEIEEALKAGFKTLIPFENLSQVYVSKELFPVFSSRLPDRKRKDINKILEKYGLKEYDSYQLLKRSGAKLPIDNIHFIDPILNFEEAFEKEFYLAGPRHYLDCKGDVCAKETQVTRGDEVFLQHEKENLYDNNAVCVKDVNNRLLGYVPRYYSKAILRFMEENRVKGCHILNVDMQKCCDECISIVLNVSEA